MTTAFVIVQRLAAAAAILALFIVPAAADAAVVASIDRADVELNESFTLEVTVDTAIDTEPDASALEKDFYIISRSEIRNTSIINGQISRFRTWTYILMAKQAGEFVIPPVVVGTAQSQPLRVTIAPVSAVLPGKSDIYVVAEVDYKKTYVQAQVLYKIRVYRAVATRQPRLSEPDISGVDVLVELAADERSFDAIINGKNYNVVERVYALFPQASGDLSIAPALFEARVLRNGRITGRKIFKSGAVEIEVQPIPPPPEDFPDAAWFPAKSVKLTEEWSRAPESLPAGEPITRRVTVTAVGQLSTQIPVIQPVESDSIKIYPDKPELRVSAIPEGILATRKDQYAMIAVESGAIRLPGLSLPWWNIDAGAWQVATLPPRTIEVVPSNDALPEQTVAAATAREPAGGTLVVHSNFWRHVAEVLAAIWILTLGVWWWSRRAASAAPGERAKAPPINKQKAALLKRARLAASNNDSREVKAALLHWGRLQWPGDAPRSMGEIAARVPDPLASELGALSRSSYGPGHDSWDGAALGRALQSFKLQSNLHEKKDAAALPPLMPLLMSKSR